MTRLWSFRPTSVSLVSVRLMMSWLLYREAEFRVFERFSFCSNVGLYTIILLIFFRSTDVSPPQPALSGDLALTEGWMVGQTKGPLLRFLIFRAGR